MQPTILPTAASATATTTTCTPSVQSRLRTKHKSNAVFRVKPYRMVKDTSGAKPYYHKDHYGGKIRVFAKCIGGARPYEMMDIMLLTQSL